jgi:hypothetical protein
MARERKPGFWTRAERELLKKYKLFYRNAVAAGGREEFFQAFMIVWFHHFPETRRLSGTSHADEISDNPDLLEHYQKARFKVGSF